MAYNREKIQAELFELQDEKYRDFHSKLIPDIAKKNIIGIRTPVLRKYAKQFAKTDETDAFLQDIPHTYYEENNLHMMLITSIKEYDKCLKEIEKFLPYIDNWATCDLPAPKCFAGHKEELLPHIKQWIHSGETYTIRYGIGMLMRLYLDEDFKTGVCRPCRGRNLRGILREYDDRVVHGDGTCQAVGCDYSLCGRAPVFRLGSSENNPKSS